MLSISKIPMSQEAVPNDRRPFHILALSGGGFRGLYTATVLEALEQQLGEPIARRFDLLCGTSAGGLLALGLALEIPASELKNLFIKQGENIFGKRGLLRWLSAGLLCARHSNHGLREALEGLFKDALLGHAKHRVIIPAVSYSTGLGQFFKTPHHETFKLDHEMPMVDVALATSAAPTYLPLAKNKRGYFVDGGLIGNSPGFFGLHEARIFLDTQPENVRVLSIGTMTIGNTIRGNSWIDRGFLMWRSKLFDLMISAQEGTVDNMLRHELKHRYFRIDEKASPEQTKDISSLDKVSSGAIETLISRATHSAQVAIGRDDFIPFTMHQASPPTFYYGPNRNAKEKPQC